MQYSYNKKRGHIALIAVNLSCYHYPITYTIMEGVNMRSRRRGMTHFGLFYFRISEILDHG